MGALDEMIEIYKQGGLDQRAARRAAFAELKEILEKETSGGAPLTGKRRAITPETLNRYYTEGVQDLRESEMRLAKEVEAVAAKVGLEAALSNYGDYGFGGVLRARYARGKRALQRLKSGK